jgi:pumilio family protein 6
MAGIKRKSAVSTPADVKTKSKKVKVEKSAPKSGSKHAVKPVKTVKKPKKVKEDASDDLDESDTSEKENGLYGFSANEETDMNDASDVDSKDGEAVEDVKQSGKADKRKSESKVTIDNKKPKGDTTDQSAAFAAANGTMPAYSRSKGC